jgi:hypothetical protein
MHVLKKKIGFCLKFYDDYAIGIDNVQQHWSLTVIKKLCLNSQKQSTSYIMPRSQFLILNS